MTQTHAKTTINSSFPLHYSNNSTTPKPHTLTPVPPSIHPSSQEESDSRHDNTQYNPLSKSSPETARAEGYIPIPEFPNFYHPSNPPKTNKHQRHK